MVLYPEEGVSEVQKQQMKTFQGHGLHVVGQFDNNFYPQKNLLICLIYVKKVCNEKHKTNKHTYVLIFLEKKNLFFSRFRDILEHGAIVNQEYLISPEVKL